MILKKRGFGPVFSANIQIKSFTKRSQFPIDKSAGRVYYEVKDELALEGREC